MKNFIDLNKKFVTLKSLANGINKTTDYDDMIILIYNYNKLQQYIMNYNNRFNLMLDRKIRLQNLLLISGDPVYENELNIVNVRLANMVADYNRHKIDNYKLKFIQVIYDGIRD